MLRIKKVLSSGLWHNLIKYFILVSEYFFSFLEEAVMRELLKSNERRRTDLIELLLNSNEWITLQSIAKELDCSTRILKEDVNFFREAGTNI